ncbi:unnamed protein product [Polarella glacialis]|nr:unnamed protein product [Polarella glacialis]
MELTHLDGRKLIIKTSPGEIVKPMARGFNPLADSEDSKTEWETFEDCDCPGVENVARAETNDVDVLKDACEKQLKRKGIDVGAFVVDARGASFKQCTREEAMEGKRPGKGKTMYVISDPNAKKGQRMMKAVKDEGMPTLKNPFIHGNLFLVLTIKFPESLSAENQAAIKKLLPPAENAPKPGAAEDPSYEVHFVTDIDPVQSFESNKVHMKDTDNAYDDDDEPQGRGGPGGAQCQQQ